MANIRNRIETWFEELAHWVYRNRIKTIIILMVIIASMVSQLPKIELDLSTEGFLHKDDPYLIEYNNFRDQFGMDEAIIIALKPENVFDGKFLKKLKALHDELEENLPYIEEITSLINARNTRGTANELIVEDLLEDWPETKEKLDLLKNRVMTNPMYKNMLVSEDGKFTTIVIRMQSNSSQGQEKDVLEGFEENESDNKNEAPSVDIEPTYLTNEENSEVVFAAEEILKKYASPDFPVYLAGSPVITHSLKVSMMKDIRKFMTMAISVIAILLFIMFRRISGVILPLIIVILSLLSTLGLMAAAGAPIKLPTQILPSFLLAVSVGASVHILAMFYYRFQKNGSREDAIAYALGHSGLPCAMTHVTTASGLISFSTASIAPIADLGIFSSIGVLLALVYTIFLLPAFLSFIPLKKKKSKGNGKKSFSTDRLLAGIANFSTTYPVSILLVTALIVILSVTVALGIRFSHSPLNWLPEEYPSRIATEKIDNELKGSVTLEIIIDTGKENGLYEPDFLNRLEKAVSHIESLDYGEIFAGKALALSILVKEINQALNENRAEYYRIPQNRDLVAQELLLFENSGSDDLQDFTDSRFSKARFTVKVPFKDAILYKELMNDVNSYFSGQFPEAKIQITGMIALLFRTIYNVAVSMAKSYLIAIVIITILMIFLIGRVRIGLLSMIPNLTPILIMLGIMGIFSFPMDVFTMLVGSIAIGLAVDDTIHFMHNFRRYYEASGDPARAVHETLQTAGRAMLVTTIVLSIGFFIFMFANMNNLFNFGLLTGLTITMALLADYFIAPALMVIVNKPKKD